MKTIKKGRDEEQKGVNTVDVVGANLQGKHSSSVVNMKTQEALEKLKDGNAKFVKGELLQWDVKQRREELKSGQHPFATIVDCADSRTAPEFIFNTRLGDIFVTRKAGNYLEKGDIGSLEYSVEHLHVPLIVVMGHQSCGAVTAACGSDHAEGNIDSIVQALQPAVVAGKKDIEASARENVKLQKEAIRSQSPLLKELEMKGEIKILGAYYSLETGKVEFF